MLKSTPDDVQLVYAVADRATGLAGNWLRSRGTALQPPLDMTRDFELFNTVSARYQRSDFRHTADEYAAVRRVAQWTIDVNCELRNQPKTQVAWKGGGA